MKMNWDGEQTAPTLTSCNADGRQRMPDKKHFNAVIQSLFIDTSHADDVSRVSEVSSPIQSRDAKGGKNVMTEENKKTVVRRLLPIECERLQGFPDNWTLIGEQAEDGEYYYTDTNGKRKRVTDSARYKALGNSICLPFWCWLARRIAAQYERDITIGSLFDGIGGFPYAFEKAGAKAVWASEIEEFPIAVTKEHFPEEDD